LVAGRRSTADESRRRFGRPGAAPVTLMFDVLAKPGITPTVAGISLGGVLVIIGIILMFVWSFWAGLIIALIGLLAFGGFARGRWY
jgi:hypothetical protein